jgi:hypothetical protein
MLAALLALSLAAPVPKIKVPALYFPTAVGTKKVMKVTLRGETGETTETVTKVEEKDGVYTVTTTDSSSKGWEYTYAVSAEGVVDVTNAGVTSRKPYVILKLPANEGDTWTNEVPVLGDGCRKIHTVGTEVEVEVPAGKYKAITVTTDFVLDVKHSITTKEWYAPGAGMVKRVSVVNGDEIIEELKEFTPGK